jgi:hypothetical protein
MVPVLLGGPGFFTHTPSTSTSMDERLSSLKPGVEEKRGLWVEDKKIALGPF